MIHAFKRKWAYLTDEEMLDYWEFVSSHILDGYPTFYSVCAKKRLNTPDGSMYILKLVTDLNNPNYEPIAECYLNNLWMYLWRDQVWNIAEDKHGAQIAYQLPMTKSGPKLQSSHVGYSKVTGRIIVAYSVGYLQATSRRHHDN